MRARVAEIGAHSREKKGSLADIYKTATPLSTIEAVPLTCTNLGKTRRRTAVETAQMLARRQAKNKGEAAPRHRLLRDLGMGMV